MKARLDKEQLKAVTYGEGPLLVTAGPGSGKTTVITHHIQYLIDSLGIPPEKILVITFTKSAAVEMKERFMHLAGQKETNVVFGTFHAFFYQILRKSGGFTHDSILKEKEKYVFLRDILKTEKITYYENSFLEDLLSEFSQIKNKGFIKEYESSLLEQNIFKKVFDEYQRRLEAVHKIDFDDMSIRCLSLLQKDDTVLRKWQEQFSYILIDEFQDINPGQYEIIKLLAKPHHNIFAVGDEDQSIYSFRGANPQIGFQFLEDYPEAKQIFLAINYRCEKEIVRGAKNLISNNMMRFDKEIEAVERNNEKKYIDKYEDGLIIKFFHHEKEEYEEIVYQLKQYKEKYSYNQCVILFRTNMISPLFFQILKEHKIPYKTKSDIKNWQENSVVKDMQAYFALAKGELTRKNLFRIMNKPSRYFSRDIVNADSFTWESIERNFKGNFTVLDGVQKLQKDLEYVKKLPVYAALGYIRRGIGYDKWLQSRGGKILRDGEEMLEQLRVLARECDTFDELWSLLEKEEIKDDNNESDAVSVMTYHGSKGLEWSVVFLPDVIEGITPYKRAKSEEEKEEERRMFYVALTRAREVVYLYSLTQDDGHKRTPSCFIKEVKRES